WAPDGGRLLACHDGTLRAVAVDGQPVRELRNTLASRSDGVIRVTDARWTADGRIIAIDSRGFVHRFSLHYEHHGDAAAGGSSRYHDVVLAPRANAFAGTASANVVEVVAPT